MVLMIWFVTNYINLEYILPGYWLFGEERSEHDSDNMDISEDTTHIKIDDDDDDTSYTPTILKTQSADSTINICDMWKENFATRST